ncbi:E2F-associated phosphoprotein isoform X2 [Dicentrarchus labrax]|uniref:E2F-associated phosphoprotein isoform X2 n=1 Tax=Dicentrarchus labrax TaxID=13489 RepID=UPI0021F673A8|nr:E2F-associated phosphoprotein isoform X2 [Dicentrarchus labrax]
MNEPNKARDYDSYELEEPSDEERAESSSEDELEVLLNGTPEQKKKLIREYLTGESESSSGDEFEKEMEAELSTTIRTMEGTWGPTAGSYKGLKGPQRTYDEVYFDSDSEDEDTASKCSSAGRRRKQRTVLTNDELLYDPDEDDRDQAWVDAKRRQYSRKRAAAASQSQNRQSQGLPSSDAILNCPACMTTLCLDCQRHDKYRTQYRAMFVMNCVVKRDEVLRYKTQQERKRSSRKRRRGQKTETPPVEAPEPAPAGMDADEVYHPVQCTECSTEVAVFDKDEVYHFFNILSSHC